MRFFLLTIGLMLAAACTPGETSAPEEQGETDAPKRAPDEIIAEAAPEDWRAIDPENMLVIDLERGRIIVELSSKLAQNHVEQIKALAREGFYDGLSFHRVIDGFVAQAGEAFGERDIKTAKETLKAVFEQPLTSDMTFTPIKDADGYAAQVGFLDSHPVGANAGGTTIWGLHCTGAMAMARDIEKDTAGVEFYFTLQPQRYLDRNLTIYGNVVDGMEHLQALPRVPRAVEPGDDLSDAILSMRVAADLPEEDRPALEIMRSDTATFAAYVESRRNRPEDFFYYRPDHLEVCALTIPVREIAAG